MANLTQDTIVSIPADEVPLWVKGDQVGIYANAVLATMITYDASEFPVRLFLNDPNDFQVCTLDKEVSAYLSITFH